METSAAKNPGCQQVETQLDAGRKESNRNPLADARPDDRPDRYRKLCDLLERVGASGPERFESEIDQIRQQCDLSAVEREVVAKIFRHGFDAALQRGNEHKTWAYQRLLRRLLVGQPLDCPIIDVDPYPPVGCQNRSLTKGENDSRAAQETFAAILPGAHRQRRASTAKRVSYAIGINVIAVLLWLGPLNIQTVDRADAQRQIESAKLEVAKPQGEKADLFPPTDTSSESTASFGKEIPTNGPTLHAPERASAQALAPGEASKVDRPARLSGSQAGTAQQLVSNSSLVQHDAVFLASREIGLRSEPRYSAPKGDALVAGTRLVVIETEGQWLKVRCERDGSIGYVRKEFVEPM